MLVFAVKAGEPSWIRKGKPFGVWLGVGVPGVVVGGRVAVGLAVFVAVKVAGGVKVHVLVLVNVVVAVLVMLGVKVGVLVLLGNGVLVATGVSVTMGVRLGVGEGAVVGVKNCVGKTCVAGEIPAGGLIVLVSSNTENRQTTIVKKMKTAVRMSYMPLFERFIKSPVAESRLRAPEGDAGLTKNHKCVQI